MKRFANSLRLLSLMFLVSPCLSFGKSVRVKYIHELDENEFVVEIQANDEKKTPLGLNSALVRLKVTDGVVYEKEKNKPSPSHPNFDKILGMGNFLNDNFQISAKTWGALVNTYDRITPAEVMDLIELCFLSKNFMITFKEVEIKLNYEWKPPLPKTRMTKQFFYKSDTDKFQTKPNLPPNLLHDIIK